MTLFLALFIGRKTALQDSPVCFTLSFAIVNQNINIYSEDDSDILLSSTIYAYNPVHRYVLYFTS